MTMDSGLGVWVRRVSEQIGERSLGNLYRSEIPELRSRSVRLFGRKCRPQIIYTFLGYELKAFGRRITCPDEATVRYLKIFAEIGMDRIQVPFDPTQTERCLKPLEEALQTLQRLAVEQFPQQPQRQKAALRALYAWTRQQLRDTTRKK